MDNLDGDKPADIVQQIVRVRMCLAALRLADPAWDHNYSNAALRLEEAELWVEDRIRRGIKCDP